MADSLQKQTQKFLRDLHARESMRLGCYRQWGYNEDRMRHLRERRSRHEAFLRDLLRKRGLKPAWYSKVFYYGGHIMGWLSGFFPEKWVQKIELTLEFWILLRYQDYLRRLKLDFNLRSMIESLKMERLKHPEPGPDVLSLIESFIAEQNVKAQAGKLS